MSKGMGYWFRLANHKDCGSVVELFVCDGISGGRFWGTFYRKPRSPKAYKRLQRNCLQMRTTREAAQADLDAFAAANGLKEAK